MYNDNTPIEGRVATVDISILLLADFANLDASGKLNIIGAFNRIHPPEFPYRHPQMHLVIRLVAGFGETDQERVLRVTIFDEDGSTVSPLPDIPFQVKAPQGGKQGEYNAIIGLQLMEFSGPGRFEFSVYVDKDLKGSVPLEVVLRERPPSSEQ